MKKTVEIWCEGRRFICSIEYSSEKDYFKKIKKAENNIKDLVRREAKK